MEQLQILSVKCYSQCCYLDYNYNIFSSKEKMSFGLTLSIWLMIKIGCSIDDIGSISKISGPKDQGLIACSTSFITGLSAGLIHGCCKYALLMQFIPLQARQSLESLYFHLETNDIWICDRK